jgi:hypothetical protein
MSVRAVLKVPLRDGEIRQARTGEPCCSATGERRLALPKPRVDGPLFLLTLVLMVLLRGEVTRPTKISGQGCSAICVPRPELQRPMADGVLHLHH